MCLKNNGFMNYEEMLAAKGDGRQNKTQLPIGEYYRTQTGGKYRGVVDILPSLNENLAFSKALKAECDRNRTLANPHQLHVEPVIEDGDVKQLLVENGVFISFEQLLNDSPAVIAEKDFITNTLEQLVDIATYLHSEGIYHICFSPKTVFARKGDHAVMLLSHGSFYQGMSNLSDFYGHDMRYVAPEVLAHGAVDERSDVYSIGKFMESLFERAGMPMEYKKALQKSTNEQPEKRYGTPALMLKAIKSMHSTIRSAMTVAAAVVIAMLCLALYFDMMPETQPVEFVKPAPRQATDDLLDDGFNPEDLGVISADSVGSGGGEAERMYQSKAEEIFRKNFEREADRILSEIYNKKFMSNSEKKFTAESSSTIEKLMRIQQQMGDDANLTPERSQLIASEIIDRITSQKMKEMGGTNSLGIQK